LPTLILEWELHMPDMVVFLAEIVEDAMKMKYMSHFSLLYFSQEHHYHHVYSWLKNIVPPHNCERIITAYQHI
jgi:hypothetical protein